MNTSKHIALAAAIAGLFTLGNSHADESRLTIKPLQAVSFEVGSERIVGYYLNENDRCTLRVMHAAEPGAHAIGSFAATTFEAIVDAGKATRYVSSMGNAFEFACADGALAMNVTQLEQVASSENR